VRGNKDKCRTFHLKSNPNYYTQILSRKKKPNPMEISDSLYPVVADDALPEVGAVVIPFVLSLDQHLSQQTLPVLRGFVASWCTLALFGPLLSR
jgi:hypothetical protein